MGAGSTLLLVLQSGQTYEVSTSFSTTAGLSSDNIAGKSYSESSDFTTNTGVSSLLNQTYNDSSAFSSSPTLSSTIMVGTAYLVDSTISTSPSLSSVLNQTYNDSSTFSGVSALSSTNIVGTAYLADTAFSASSIITSKYGNSYDASVSISSSPSSTFLSGRGYDVDISIATNAGLGFLSGFAYYSDMSAGAAAETSFSAYKGLYSEFSITNNSMISSDREYSMISGLSLDTTSQFQVATSANLSISQSINTNSSTYFGNYAELGANQSLVFNPIVSSSGGNDILSDCSISSASNQYSNKSITYFDYVSVGSTSFTNFGAFVDNNIRLNINSLAIFESSDSITMNSAQSITAHPDITSSGPKTTSANAGFTSLSRTTTSSRLEAYTSLGLNSHPGMIDDGLNRYGFSSNISSTTGFVFTNTLNLNGRTAVQAHPAIIYANNNDAQPSSVVNSNASIIVRNNNVIDVDISNSQFANFATTGHLRINSSTLFDSIPSVYATSEGLLNPSVTYSSVSGISTLSEAVMNGSFASGMNALIFSQSKNLIDEYADIQNTGTIEFINSLDINANNQVDSTSATDTSNDLIIDSAFLNEAIGGFTVGSQVDFVGVTEFHSSVFWFIDTYWLFYRLPFSTNIKRREFESDISQQKYLADPVRSEIKSSVSRTQFLGLAYQKQKFGAFIDRSVLESRISTNQFASEINRHTWNPQISIIPKYIGVTKKIETLTLVVQSMFDGQLVKVTWRT